MTVPLTKIVLDRILYLKDRGDNPNKILSKVSSEFKSTNSPFEGITLDTSAFNTINKKKAYALGFLMTKLKVSGKESCRIKTSLMYENSFIELIDVLNCNKNYIFTSEKSVRLELSFKSKELVDMLRGIGFFAFIENMRITFVPAMYQTVFYQSLIFHGGNILKFKNSDDQQYKVTIYANSNFTNKSFSKILKELSILIDTDLDKVSEIKHSKNGKPRLVIHPPGAPKLIEYLYKIPYKSIP